MNDDLDALEERINQLIALADGLRSENLELRARVAHAQNDNKALQDKILVARGRLETLLGKIPDS